jgi:hypothetical protein
MKSLKRDRTHLKELNRDSKAKEYDNRMKKLLREIQQCSQENIRKN